jgi:hypothetical protein
MNKQFAQLQVYQLGGGIAFGLPTTTTPFLVIPSGQATIKPWGNSGFLFENIVTGDVIAFVNDYDDVLDSSDAAYGVDQPSVFTALAAFFFDVAGGGGDDLAQVLINGNSAGATDIDMNGNDIGKVSVINFSISSSANPSQGGLGWNTSLGTLDLGLAGGNTISNLGQHLHARVVNKTTPLVNLTKAGYEVVIVAGATGQRLSVKLAKADNDANSAGTLGIVAENIAGNAEGFICSVGNLTNINTTGSLQGETWNDGDSLYLSPTTFGAITNVKPSAPFHEVRLGYVEYAHAVNGKIYVKIDNGYELDELHNVSITSAAKGDFLEYNGTLWVNRGIVYTVELMDALTVDFYAPYDLKINSTTNIKNAPTITILDDGAAYTLTNTIAVGSKITVTASVAGVTNLNITKA